MPQGRRIPPETARAVVAAYAAGEKRIVIALVHGITPRSVSNLARAAGAPRRPRGSQLRPDPAKVRRAAADYAAGASLNTIAARLGVAFSTVRRWVAAAGVPMRARGGPRGRRGRREA